MIQGLSGEKKDNSNAWLKAEMRRAFLPEDARVLDLFCGTGEMYRRAYEGRALQYRGIDKAQIHDVQKCTLIDNVTYVTRHDMDKYNVYDLDDYGCPWALLYLILRKRAPGEITVFITDGLPLRFKLSGKVTALISGIEQIPRDMKLPGQFRFYVDMFATMLLDVERRYGWKTEQAVYTHNDGATVYYWALKMRKE